LTIELSETENLRKKMREERLQKGVK
jgi:hypothetical protein